ncbi:hypothetical protein ACVWXM_006993 [Bradyrhizobium sp. GM7.3]
MVFTCASRIASRTRNSGQKTVLFSSSQRSLEESPLVEPYQGALYTFQRIAALIAVQLPWEYAPIGFMAFAWVAFLSVLLWCMSDRIPAPLYMRAALAIIIAYAPAKNETYLNLVNAHWMLSGLGLLLLLVSTAPTRPIDRVFDYAMCVLLGLTGPFILIYLPIFASRAYLQRDLHSKTLLVLAVALATIQILQIGSRDYQLMGGELSPSAAQFASVFAFRFLRMFIGYDLVPFRTLPLSVAMPVAVTITAAFF